MADRRAMIPASDVERMVNARRHTTEHIGTLIWEDR